MSIKSEVEKWKYSNFLSNKKNNFDKSKILNILPKNDIDDAYETISKWDNYSPTPLEILKKLSKN